LQMQEMKYSTAHANTLLLGRCFTVSRRNSHILETTNRRASATIRTDLFPLRVPLSSRRTVTSTQPTRSANACRVKSNARRYLHSQTPKEISSCMSLYQFLYHFLHYAIYPISVNYTIDYQIANRSKHMPTKMREILTSGGR